MFAINPACAKNLAAERSADSSNGGHDDVVVAFTAIVCCMNLVVDRSGGLDDSVVGLSLSIADNLEFKSVFIMKVEAFSRLVVSM